MDTGNIKLASRLRDMAETMEKEIARRIVPRLENTPKRAREAAEQRKEARRLEKVRAALNGLAGAHERSQVSPFLQFITSKKQIEHILNGYSLTVQEQQALPHLLALCDPAAGQVTAADKIKEMERELIGSKIPGFFPTPAEIVKLMLRYADIQPGDKVLEPSAGKGNIADLVREYHPDAQLEVMECHYSLREILKYKGHNLIAQDCLEHRNPIYNVIVMNPPFENLADIDHVTHAYTHYLQDGGRLVSVMGESAFFRQDKKAHAFRAWLAEIGGGVIDLPAGAFKESGTGVKTRIIIVDKPYSNAPQTADLEQDGDDTPEESVQPEISTTAEDMISLAVDLGLLPDAQEGDDPLEQFLDEEGEFLPLYPDDIEAEIADAPEPLQDAPQSVIEETPSILNDRDLQKALPGFASDKLIPLNRTKMF